MKKALCVCGLFFMFLFLSCDSEKIYNKNGIRFTIPKGWKITNENVYSNTFDLSCGKSGLFSSGLVSISYVNDSIDSNENLIQYIKEMNLLSFALKAKFTEPADKLFNKYESRFARLNSKPIVAAQNEEIYCFLAFDKSFTIIIHQAKKDSISNQLAIEKIINSFECYE